MSVKHANLQLSPEEMRLVSDPGWILTKNSIVAKVVEMMAGLADAYREVWYEEGWSPKISRGENYSGLPWVMLDYPRVFGREDVLAVRTFFWWGQGWNVILHLKGVYRDLYLPVILERWQELEAAGFHVGIHSDEWRHEHTDEVYRPFSEIGGRARSALAAVSARLTRLTCAAGLARVAGAVALTRLAELVRAAGLAWAAGS